MFANIGNVIKKLLSLFLVGIDGAIKAIKEVYVVGEDGTIKKVFGSNPIIEFFKATVGQSSKYVIASDDKTLTIQAKTFRYNYGNVRTYYALNNSGNISNAVVEFDYTLVGGGSNYQTDFYFRQYPDSSVSAANYYTVFKNAESGASASGHIKLVTNSTFVANSYIEFAVSMNNDNPNFNTLTITNFTINGTQYAFDANASN